MRTQTREEEVIVPLFVDYRTQYIRDSIGKILELIIPFSKITGSKTNMYKSIVSMHFNNVLHNK